MDTRLKILNEIKEKIKSGINANILCAYTMCAENKIFDDEIIKNIEENVNNEKMAVNWKIGDVAKALLDVLDVKKYDGDEILILQFIGAYK